MGGGFAWFCGSVLWKCKLPYKDCDNSYEGYEQAEKRLLDTKKEEERGRKLCKDSTGNFKLCGGRK